jgi:hypothetical protein
MTYLIRQILSNGDRTIRQDERCRWSGAIDGKWLAEFVDDRNGTAEQNAKKWLAWRPDPTTEIETL